MSLLQWNGPITMTGKHNRILTIRSNFEASLSKSKTWALAASLAALTFGSSTTEAAEIIGIRTKWHPLEIRFVGGNSFCETSDPSTDGKINPFLDRRLNVTFTHFDAQSMVTHTQVVPGFFAGDAQGGACGNTWMVRFTPDASGLWTYTASFRKGSNVNLSLNPNAGSPLLFNGASGSFNVNPRDPNAPGFLSKGRLQYVGAHYLKHADAGFFIKGGTDSPENLFGADAFDDTIDQPGGNPTSGLANGIHHFTAHDQDFGPTGLGSSTDPYWTSNLGGDSRGIIGLLNYLSSRDVNSIYFLPMNLGGDGRETYPFVDPSGSTFANTHYDLSKLRQWNLALNHAQEKGIMWNCVLSETETANESWFGTPINNLSNQRKLFYREMVARFSYLNGIKWNLGEEATYSSAGLNSFADYIGDLDPNDHMITFHTNSLPNDGSYPLYTQALGDPRFSATSIQDLPNQVGLHVEKWRNDSAASGRKWVVDSDEHIGGISSTNIILRRKTTLYDVLFSGGNIEWYFGAFSMPDGGDLNAEDLRTRQDMWDFTSIARHFLTDNLNFASMTPDDSLVVGESQTYGGAEVLATKALTYAVYFPDATNTGTIELEPGNYRQRWFNPRDGLFDTTTTLVSGGGPRPIGSPPSMPSEDWVTLFERDFAGFQLGFTPLAPGIPDLVNSSSISGATPGAPILILYSVDGTGTIPLSGCSGESYNLLNVKYGFSLFANSLGNASFALVIASGPPPGTIIYLQAIDPFGCGVSPVTTFTW